MADDEQIAWTAISQHASVVDASGSHLGKVELVLADEGEDIFHGLAVRLDNGHTVELAADHVERITTEHVYTNLASNDVSSLPAYEKH